MSGGLLLLLLPAFSARSWSIRACQNRGNAREHDGVSDLRWKPLHYTFGNESRRGFADLLSLSLGPAAARASSMGIDIRLSPGYVIDAKHSRSLSSAR